MLGSRAEIFQLSFFFLVGLEAGNSYWSLYPVRLEPRNFQIPIFSEGLILDISLRSHFPCKDPYPTLTFSKVQRFLYILWLELFKVRRPHNPRKSKLFPIFNHRRNSSRQCEINLLGLRRSLSIQIVQSD